MKRTIKQKIQKSMIVANLLTLFIMSLLVVPGFILTLYPVTYFITKSASDDIVKKYEETLNGEQAKSQMNKTISMQYTVQEIIDSIVSKNLEEMEIPDEMTSNSNASTITISDDDDIKRLMIIASDTYDEVNDFLNAYMLSFDILNIDVEVNDYALNLTKSVAMDKEGELYKMVNTHQRSVGIVDEDGNSIGTLHVTIDPQLIAVVVIPYVIMLIVIFIVSIVIVKIVSAFMSKGIMRPITQMNRQLNLIAEHQIHEVSRFTLGIKNPPEEIAEMIQSSNAIYDKFRDFQMTLENQNEELIQQNEELVNNRLIIENQQNQLIQTEKMASVGQITAAIVHEINTPIGAIKSNAQMTDMVLKNLSSATDIEIIHKQIGKITPSNQVVIDASNRVIEIIRSIKTFSRIDQSKFQAADLKEDLESVLLLTSNLWKSRIEIVRDYDAVPKVMCYASLLNQVFMNLITNAIDAIEGNGQIILRLKQEGDQAVISVEDNGQGMTPETLTRIFDRGFTTKPIGKGTGLGLAISKDIVDKHMGQIEAVSEIGVGTRFSVRIPIEDRDASKAL